jgi:regulator of sigma E protease
MEQLADRGVEVVRFLIVIGVLIFVHELGHFIMAKRARIFVERFSFGFGPRLFGLKIGETDYCVSAILFGGYVKMAGQEDVPGADDAVVPEERKFTSKTVLQRAGILVAGPLMNLVLGFVIFIAVMLVGQQIDQYMFDTRIGLIEKGSPAEQAGLKPGDKVLSVNGKRVTKWQDLAMMSLSNAEREMTLDVERGGQRMNVPVWSRDFDGTGQPRMGIDPFVPAIIGTPTKGKPAYDAGLQRGDTIVAINGVPVDASETRRITSESVGKPLEYEIERGGTRFKKTIAPAPVGEIDLRTVIIVNGRVKRIQEDFAKATGLSSGDEIRFINNVAVEPKEVEDIIARSPNSKLTLGIHRPPNLILGIIPVGEGRDFSVELQTRQRGVIGVPLYPLGDVPMPRVLVRYNIVQAVPQGIRQGWSVFVTSLNTVKLLITGRVSPKALAGPLGIYDMTQEAAREGLDWLAMLVGVISIYLGIFNLFPLPVLDGGLVAFLLVEAIRKKPVSIRYQEALQYVGIAVFVALFLFITYNDILRRIGERFIR